MAENKGENKDEKQEKSPEEKGKEAAQNVAEAAGTAARIASGAKEGGWAGVAKAAIKEFLTNAKFRKFVLIQTLIATIIPILITVLIISAFMAVISAVMEVLRNILNGAIKFFKKLGNLFVRFWQWLTGDYNKYWIDLEKKFELTDDGEAIPLIEKNGQLYRVDDSTGEADTSQPFTGTYAYTVVDRYLKQCVDSGIDLSSLKLLGENADYNKYKSNIEELLTNEELRELAEKYISEYVRADLITSSMHKNYNDTNTVNPDNQMEIDGANFLYRTQYDDEITPTSTTTGESVLTVTEMQYLVPKQFYERPDEYGISEMDLLKYFSVDEDTGELLIYAVDKEESQGKTYIEPTASTDDATGGCTFTNGLYQPTAGSTTTTHRVVKLNYKDAIADYIMPFEYLTAINSITQCPEFTYHVAFMARKNRVILVVADDIVAEREYIATGYDNFKARYKEITGTYTYPRGYYNQPDVSYSNTDYQEWNSYEEGGMISGIFGMDLMDSTEFPKIPATARLYSYTDYQKWIDEPHLLTQYADAWRIVVNNEIVGSYAEGEDTIDEVSITDETKMFINYSRTDTTGTITVNTGTEENPVYIDRTTETKTEEQKIWAETKIDYHFKASITRQCIAREKTSSVIKSDMFYSLLRESRENNVNLNIWNDQDVDTCRFGDDEPGMTITDIVSEPNASIDDYTEAVAYHLGNFKFDEYGFDKQYYLPYSNAPQTPIYKMGNEYKFVNAQFEAMVAAKNALTGVNDAAGAADADQVSQYTKVVDSLTAYNTYLFDEFHYNIFKKQDPLPEGFHEFYYEYREESQDEVTDAEPTTDPDPDPGGQISYNAEDIAWKIWCALLDAGYSEEAAAGVLGNIEAESGFNPGAVNPSSGAFGLAQWLGGRKDKLYAYCDELDVEYTDADAQIAYLIAEITGNGECNASFQYMSAYSEEYNNWKNATSPENAGTNFCRWFERPATTVAAVKRYFSQKRCNYSRQWYDRFHGKDPSTYTPTPGGGGGGAGGADYNDLVIAGVFRDNAGHEFTNYKQYPPNGAEEGTWEYWCWHNGCGLTSMAIILGAYDSKVDPYYLYHYEHGRGPMGGVYFGHYIQDAGMNYYTVTSIADIRKALQEGKKVMMHLKGNATIDGEKWAGSVGHFIAALEINDSDEVYISNPGSGSASKNGWIPLTKFSGVLSGSQYVIY